MYWIFFVFIFILLLVILGLSYLLYSAYKKFLQQEVKIHMLKAMLEKTRGANSNDNKEQ